MKKITVIILAVIMTVLMSGCKSPNFANIDPYQEPEVGETIITGTVEQVSGDYSSESTIKIADTKNLTLKSRLLRTAGTLSIFLPIPSGARKLWLSAVTV